jgi:hypothetical protein
MIRIINFITAVVLVTVIISLVNYFNILNDASKIISKLSIVDYWELVLLTSSILFVDTLLLQVWYRWIANKPIVARLVLGATYFTICLVGIIAGLYFFSMPLMGNFHDHSYGGAILFSLTFGSSLIVFFGLFIFPSFRIIKGDFSSYRILLVGSFMYFIITILAFILAMNDSIERSDTFGIVLAITLFTFLGLLCVAHYRIVQMLKT